MTDQPPLWEEPVRATGALDAWITEARERRGADHTTRTLRGQELRRELSTCRALGLRARQADRLRRARAKEQEET